MKNSRFTVQVPASTTNLGAGFDTLSAALDLHLRVDVELVGGDQIEWAGGWDPAEDNILARSMESTLKILKVDPPGMRITMKNSIPLKRGLGSSAAAIIAGIRIAEQICGTPLSEARRFEIGYPLEGHPDNLAASLLGGWVLSWVDGGKMKAERVPSSLSCRFVLAVPDVTVSTREARAILPASYPRAAVVQNLQRCALLVHILHTGRKEWLREATRDQLHQAYRAPLVPGLKHLMEVKGLRGTLADSLLGIFISGSGSTAAALADGHYDEIGNWMVETLAGKGTSAFYRVVDLDTWGVRVSEDGEFHAADG